MSSAQIELTDRAANHIKSYLASTGEGIGFRLGVKPTGCSGYQYVVEAAKDIGDHDTAFESNGVKIVVDEQSLKYLNGTELDYVREGLNEGFKFNNPNVQQTCGCGESFTI
jgi:iron-sulfur cluster assembly protein